MFHSFYCLIIIYTIQQKWLHCHIKHSHPFVNNKTCKYSYQGSMISIHASTVINAAWFLWLFNVQSSGLSKTWFCCHFHYSLSNNYKSSGKSILFDPNLIIVKCVHICSNSYWIVSRITLSYKTKNPSLHFRHFCSLFTRLEVGNCVHLSISFSQISKQSWIP